MDHANTPAPSLILSLEAMINASVSSALDRRLGPIRDPLNVQIEAAVASALDRRIGRAGNDLDIYIQGSIASAIRQRFGPVGSPISAQITFGTPQSAVRQSAQPSGFTVAPTTTRVRSSSAPKSRTRLEDLGYDVELAKAQLEMLNENGEDYTTNRMVLENDLAALQERNTAAVGADNAQTQTGPNPSGNVVAKGDEANVQARNELQVVVEEAMSDILAPGRTLPAKDKTLPKEKTPDSAWQKLGSSSTKSVNPAEPVGTAAQIRIDRGLETDNLNCLRINRPRGKDMEYVDTAVENLPSDPGETEKSLVVAGASNVTTAPLSNERKAGSTGTFGTLPRLDEHTESLAGNPNIATGNGIIPSNPGPTAQLRTANNANEKVMEVIPIPQRGVDTLAKGGYLLEGTASRSNDLPHPELSVVFGSNNGGNGIPMDDQIKGISGGLGQASSQNSSSLLETSISDPPRKCSTPTDCRQAVTAEEVEPPFEEKQGEAVQRSSATTKRKAGTLEDAAGVSAGTDGNEASHKKKRVTTNPPGYTEGSPIRFLRVCSQLTARAKGRRGYPQVVDRGSFTNDSNKQYFTMADIVATILWNYKPKSLEAFLDT